MHVHGHAVDTRLNNIAIIGVGLIGSSIARAARLWDPSLVIKGHDASVEVRDVVRRLNLFDEVSGHAHEIVDGADLVIFCVPIGQIEAIAMSVAPAVGSETIVTDTASSKSAVSAILRKSMPKARLVPAHPVAGSEQSGPLAGSPDLFKGRWCILTPERNTEPSDVEAVSRFWEALGAKVDIMSAGQHDLVLAAISHVPHLFAFSAVAAVAELEKERGYPFLDFAAGGFRDFTRIAAANPHVWKDIFLSNKEAILEVSSIFRAVADRLQQAILGNDERAILEELITARAVRSQMFSNGASDE